MVTLVLNGVDITCEVAPAVIFYNVYECGSDDAEQASKDIDTSAAGANVIIADGTIYQDKGRIEAISGIIDPTKVSRVALENAASIASMFLTTECVLAEKPSENPLPAMPAGGMGGMM